MGMQWIPSNTNIDLIGKRNLFVGSSVAVLILSVIAWFVIGPNYGIDFLGGVNVQIKTPTTVTTDEIRKIINDLGVKHSVIQEFQVPGGNAREFGIKISSKEGTPEVLGPQLTKLLPEKVPGVEIRAIDTVGPFAGKDLRNKAGMAMFWSWVMIFIYIVLRFDIRYAPGAVIALIHDAVITLGCLVVMGRELNISVLAAILTIIGYSINDTVIVYDRIRERLQLHPEFPLAENINRAVNETLSRTILTVFTVMLTTASLVIFGKGAVDDLAITLLIGLFIGSYSSVYVASPFVLWMDQWQKNRESKKLKAA